MSYRVSRVCLAALLASAGVSASCLVSTVERPSIDAGHGPCDAVVCTNGNTCDPQDGICKCHGLICNPNDICSPTAPGCPSHPICEGVVCGNGSTCDPADGKCKCNGVLCGAGSVCLGADGGCWTDPCYGVHCAGADEGIQCILGVCRCGQNGTVTVDDPVCSRVQRCQQGTCVALLGCNDVPPCYGNNVCNPQDLQCHCGTRNGPICQPSESCRVVAVTDAGEIFTCNIGNDCNEITCTDGQICDPNLNFNCACETAQGLGGPPCQQNQYCLALDPTMPPVCIQMCNPYVQQECLTNDAGFASCYAEFFDGGGNGAGVCESPLGGSIGAVGDRCRLNTDCQGGLGCWTRSSIVNGDAGSLISTCQPYCDNTSATMAGMYPCTPPQYCTPVGLVQADGQLVQIGYCQ